MDRKITLSHQHKLHRQTCGHYITLTDMGSSASLWAVHTVGGSNVSLFKVKEQTDMLKMHKFTENLEDNTGYFWVHC